MGRGSLVVTPRRADVGRTHSTLDEVCAVIERQATIVNPLGMHARPAARLVKLASGFQSHIELVKDDLAINGKSIMGVMMLAAECGSSITIRAEGPDAEAALDALVALVAEGFGES
jgi:phosphocarrier protein